MVIEELQNETNIRIDELKKVLELVKKYDTKELIVLAIEGRIDGLKTFLKGISDE